MMNEMERSLFFDWVKNNEYERICAWVHNNPQLIPEILGVIDSNGWNALHHAAFRGYEEILECLLELNADIETRDPVGQTPLILSASRNCIGAVRRLLQYGADVDAVDNEGHNALFESIELGTFDVMKLLVEAGSNVNLTDNMHFNSLMWIAWNGMEWEKFYEDLGIDIECATKEGWTALFLACKHNNTRIMEALLNRGADYTRPDIKGRAVCDLVNQAELETKRVFEEYLLRAVPILSPTSSSGDSSSSEFSQALENKNGYIPPSCKSVTVYSRYIPEYLENVIIPKESLPNTSEVESELTDNQYYGYEEDVEDRDEFEDDEKDDLLLGSEDI